MSISGGSPDDRSFALATPAAAVLDAHGTVVRWSAAAARLVGRAASEVCGRPVRELLAEPGGRTSAADEAGIPAAGRAVLRHGSGGTVDVTFRTTRCEGGDGHELLVLAAPTEQVAEQEQSLSFLRALLAQDRIGVGLHDTELTIVRSNVTAELLGGPPAPQGSRLAEILTAEDAAEAETALRGVLETGVPLIARHHRVRSPQVPGREWALALSAFRLEDSHRRPTGVAVVFSDVTEQQRARRHLGLLHEAAVRVGGSLDVVRTSRQLAEVVVPELGDLASVDLAEAVLAGDEPPRWLGAGDPHMRKVATVTAAGDWPAGHVQVGEAIPAMPQIDRSLVERIRRDGVLLLGRDELVGLLGGDPRLMEKLVPEGGRSTVLAPLFARGLMLGSLSVWRTDREEPFGPTDAELLKEIASRGALAIDNARRYTREHRAAVDLQERLLPQATTDLPAVETAGLYRPAGGGAEISGDWFDVIPLPSLRVALVVGDVVGHGMHATATMGRLRTAVHTLADLELDPEDLFTHLEDLVQRLREEAPPALQDAVGATCLYGVYDPVAGRCAFVSAGHPPPVVLSPDGTARTVGLVPGPPLAVGGMPYETTTVDLEPGSVLALCTDGLIERDGHDPDAGLRELAAALPSVCRPGRSLQDSGRALLSGLGGGPPRDDIALLLARTRALPAGSTASWEFPADPAAVSQARAAATGQLGSWGLEELAFTTGLIVSELVTNAVRYGGAPIGLRLIRGPVLVCEVTDPSNTQPRLRRARTTDEGGRGLFLIAQLSTRWGCRYGRRGKTIWSEQALV